MKRLFLMLFALGSAVSLMAETGVWGGSTASQSLIRYDWDTTGCWVDGYVPSNGDDVDFSFWPGTGQNRLYLECVELASKKGHTFGTLSGTYGRGICWDGRGSDSSYVLSIADPCGWLGWFDLYGWGTFCFSATDSFTPFVRRMHVRDVLHIDVPTANTMAAVSNLYGAGMIVKKGAGRLEVGRIAPGTRLHVSAGSVKVGGSAPDDASLLASALAKAALHLDASAPETIDTDETGHVTKWRDVRPSSSRYAAAARRSASSRPYNLPTMVENFQNGLPVVDFGDYGTETAATNPATTTAALQFDAEIPLVRDAFFVEADRTETVSGGVRPCLLASGISTKVFIRGTNGSIFDLTSGAETGNPRITDPLTLRDGEFRVDGATINQYSHVFSGTELKLLSYTPRDEATYVPMGALATEYGARVGGIRVGEVIIFTEKLTEQERSAVIRHLLAKWKPSALKPDLDRLQFSASSSAALDVPEGETLRVEELRTKGTTLTKTGAGTLAVRRLDGVSTINVNDGDVAFDSTFVKPSAVPAPASSPYRHYDASDTGSIVYDTDYAGQSYISGWLDRSRDAAKTAHTITNTPNKNRTLGYPQLVENAQNGLPAISFGVVVETPTNAPNSAAMGFDDTTDCFADNNNIREVFYVYKQNGMYGIAPKTYLLGNYNGYDSYTLDFYPHYSTSMMFRPGTASGIVLSGLWSLDGSMINPSVDMDQATATSFHVYHGAFASPVLSTAFFLDRGGAGLVGGGTIAEVILYDRELTKQERVDTEAYLVEKWMGVAHPASTGLSPTVNFAAGRPATVAADGDTRLGVVSSGTAALNKCGDGALTVVEADMANLDSVTVEGGSLTIARWMDTPAFHFDAADTNSLTLVPSDNGDGTVRTNVTQWADTRGTGLVATPYYDTSASAASRIAFTNPVYTAKSRADGKVRPLVDFGKKSTLGSSQYPESSAGLKLSRRFTNIREAHCVFSDANGANTMFVFTDLQSYNYHRYGNQISRNDSSPTKIVGEGTIESDGVPKTRTYVPSGFHVLSFVPTADTAIGSIAVDRTSGCGGCYISEMVGFTNALPEARRKYVEAMLVRKWGTVNNASYVVWTNELQSVTVKSGGVFRPVDDLAEKFTLSATSFSGGGMVDADVIVPSGGVLAAGDADAAGTFAVDGNLTLADGASLEFDISGSGCDSISVSGAFTAEGAVSVSVAGMLAIHPHEAVDYTLIAADGGMVADLSAWTLSPDAGGRFRASLLRDGDAIKLRLVGKGTVLNIR